MTLYEISQAYMDLLAEIEENEGELTDELLIKAEGVEQGFEQKAETYASIIKNLEADAAAIEAEEKRLSKRKIVKKNIANRMKERLSLVMQQCGKEKFETERHKISFWKSASVKILDEKKIPAKYFKTTKTPIKSDIAAAINAGIKIRGAEIVNNKTIQVR